MSIYSMDSERNLLKQIIEKYWTKNLSLRIKSYPLLYRLVLLLKEEHWLWTSEVLYVLYHNLDLNTLLCPVCMIKYKSFYSFEKWFWQYCSCICSGNSKKTRDLCKLTCNQKYWVENVMKNKDIKERNSWTQYFWSFQFKENQKEYNLNSLWVIHPMYSTKIKNKIKSIKKERYWDENYNNKEKRKKTNIEKYWVETKLLLKEIVDKRKEIHTRNLYKDILSKISDLVELDLTLEQYITKNITSKFQFTCKICKTKFTDYLNYNWFPKCPKCYPSSRIQPEEEIVFYLKTILNIFVIEQKDRKKLFWKELEFFFLDEVAKSLQSK